jgi:eukaryotic-like serine/threonine-protein kinase
MTGSVVAHYRIVDKLGTGGMGVVYRAEDLQLGRTVALKFLSDNYATDPLAVDRFRREARTASALNHPGICTIHDVGEHDGRPFIVMELLQGRTLRDCIGRKPLPIREMVDWAVQIVDAVDAAHLRGIVHRDLKPANVFVTDRGNVKVLDFGLAKLLKDSNAAIGDATASLELTTPGTTLGTVAYMSPEQVRGDEVDARSDLFSIGVLLYEMVTGRTPFTGATAGSILEGILAKTPRPVREFNPQVPEELERIIGKSLEKDRNLRVQTAAELRADLKSLQGALLAPRASTFSIAVPQRRRARVLVWAATASLLIVLIAVVYLLVRQRGGASWKNATFVQLTTQPGEEMFPSLAPDGKSFVYAGRAGGDWDIYLQRVGGKNPINLTPDSAVEDTQPAFSPDGERIAFRSERDGGGIFVMGATGESAMRLTNFGYYPAWSPDGRQIVFQNGKWGHATRADGGQLFVIAAGEALGDSQPQLLTPGLQHAYLANWSPRGHRIAFFGIDGGNRDIWTLPAAGGTPVQVTRDPATDWHPVWSPDGNHLYYLSDRSGSMNLWRVAIDLNSGQTSDQPEQVTIPSTDIVGFCFARQGRRFAYVNRLRSGNIARVPFDPVKEAIVGPVSLVTHGSWLALTPDVSPDGQWVAFNTWNQREDIYIARVDGSGQLQLTDDEHRDRFPNWSPDGKRIAFYSNRTGVYEFWNIKPDGSGLQQLTYFNDPEVGVLNPTWSPDGSRLVATRTAGGPASIFHIGEPWVPPSSTLPATSGRDLRVSSWSPDGRCLAGSMAAPGRQTGIGVYCFDSGAYRQYTDFGWYPRWMSDSRRLMFSTAGEPGIYLLDTLSGKAREILSVAPNAVRVVAPAHDGRWIYFGLTIDEADVWMMSWD